MQPQRSEIRQVLLPLFPEQRRPLARINLLGASTAMICAIIFGMSRVKGPGAWNSVWAEDGRNFLSDALLMSPIEALFTPFNGYFHTVPRILAQLTRILPLEWAALVISASAAGVAAAVALMVYVASGDHFQSPVSRFIVAFLPVIAPVGQGQAFDPNGGSIINNLATLQFVLLYAAFWLFLWTPARQISRWTAGLAILLIALTTPLSIVLVPLALIRVFVRPNRYSWGIFSALSIGVCIQFGATYFGVTTRAGVGGARMDPIWALQEYANWLMPNAFFGEFLVQKIGQNAPTLSSLLPFLAAALALLVCAIWLLKLTQPRWHLAVAALVTSVGLTLIQLMVLGSTADRYLYTPGLLLIVAVVAMLTPSGDSWDAKAPLAAFMLMLIVVCATNWQVTNDRMYTRSWQEVVGEARAKCAWAAATDKVVVHTHTRNLDWTTTLPCARLQ